MVGPRGVILGEVSRKNAGEVGCTGRTGRWGRGLDQRREPFFRKGDDGDGGGGLMGQSRSDVALGRASGGASTRARAWSLSMQPLAPEVPLYLRAT